MRCSRWIVVTLVAGGLGACERTSEAQARKDSKPPVATPRPGEDPDVFQGTVTAVGDNQFIVRGRNGLEEPFEINDKTDFIHNGEAVQRKELQEGKHVRARFDQQAGKKVADEVEIY